MVSLKANEKKPPVILDIGNAFTKAGYAGDDEPICVIPSRLQEINDKRWLRDIQSLDELRRVLRSFLRRLYLKHLLVSMGERVVVVCEPLLCPHSWKNTVAQVLLVDFEVPAVVFAPRHLLSLYTLGISTALVVHSGYTETLVLPIYENLVLLNSYQSHHVGAKAIEQNLVRELSETAKVEIGGQVQSLQDCKDLISEKQVEDIKVRMCFVTTYDRAEALSAASQSGGGDGAPVCPADVKYPLTGNTLLHIPGRVRETACEILYESEGCEQTLASVVLDAIVQCPIDTRKKLASNIVLIGGNTMIPGYKHRLQQELLHLCKQQQYLDKTSVDTFAFHHSPVKENYTAWLGGAIFGASGRLEQHAVTRDEFEALNHCVPDWSTYSPTSTTQQYDTAV